VINDDDDDGEGAEKIEPGLAFAMNEARIDDRLRNLVRNGGTLTKRLSFRKRNR